MISGDLEPLLTIFVVSSTVYNFPKYDSDQISMKGLNMFYLSEFYKFDPESIMVLCQQILLQSFQDFRVLTQVLWFIEDIYLRVTVQKVIQKV